MKRSLMHALCGVAAIGAALGTPLTPAIAAEEYYYSEQCLANAASNADRFAAEGAETGQNWTDLFIYFLSGCTPLNTPGRGRPNGGGGGMSPGQFCMSYTICDVTYLATRIQQPDDS